MAGAGNNIYNQVTTGLQGAQTGINNAMAYQPTQFSNEAIQPFMNPFTQNVLDRSMANLEDARTKAINAGQAKAMQAGAYGGSRHGIVDKGINEVFAKQAGDLSANLNQANFQQAVNQFNRANQLGFQTAQNQLAGAGALANLSNLGFGMANTMDNTAYQRAERERMIAQQLADRARQQFTGFTTQGQQGFQNLLASLGIIPAQGITTEQYQPGLMDYLKIPLAIYKYSNPASAMMPY